MLVHRRSRFESLENRIALAVTATVSAGDLVVQGDADGDVAITSVGSGTFEVRDNGVLIADSTTLTGVSDDIQIKIDQSASANNTVTLDLGTQAVDQIYASLGDGTNSLSVTGGSAASFVYKGGSGDDAVALTTPFSGRAAVKLGNGTNGLSISGALGQLFVSGGSGADTVTLAATAEVSGNVFAWLGGGDNTTTVDGSVTGHLGVSGGSGVDTVSLTTGSSVGKNVRLQLGDGNNVATAAGSIGGSLKFDGRAGNDSLTIEATAAITDDLFARLGAGDNIVIHNGSISGDLNVTSANANDTVTVATTAVVGGIQTLTLGEQTENRGRGGCSHNTGSNGSTGTTTTTGATGSTTTPTASSRAATVARLAAAISRLRR